MTNHRSTRARSAVTALALVVLGSCTPAVLRPEPDTDGALKPYEPERVGRIRVGTAQIVVTGRVTALDGTRVAGARVGLSEQESNLQGPRCPGDHLGAFFEAFGDALSDLPGALLGAKPKERRRVCPNGVTGRSDEDGRFELRLGDPIGTAFIHLVAKGPRGAVTSLSLAARSGGTPRLELITTAPRIRVEEGRLRVEPETPPWAHGTRILMRRGRSYVAEWEIDDAMDPRMIEDFHPTAWVTLWPLVSSSSVQANMTAPPVRVGGSGPHASSRGLRCRVVYRGGSQILDPCPYTDGSLSPVIDVPPCDTCTGDLRWVEVDLGRARALKGIALRGCVFCSLRVGKTARGGWRKPALTWAFVGTELQAAGFDEEGPPADSKGKPLSSIRRIRLREPDGATELSLFW